MTARGGVDLAEYLPADFSNRPADEQAEIREAARLLYRAELAAAYVGVSVTGAGEGIITDSDAEYLRRCAHAIWSQLASEDRDRDASAYLRGLSAERK